MVYLIEKNHLDRHVLKGFCGCNAATTSAHDDHVWKVFVIERRIAFIHGTSFPLIPDPSIEKWLSLFKKASKGRSLITLFD
jgi:hypothetical protein